MSLILLYLLITSTLSVLIHHLQTRIHFVCIELLRLEFIELNSRESTYDFSTNFI